MGKTDPRRDASCSNALFVVGHYIQPNFHNNLFASTCDKRRPGDGFSTTTMGMSMNDNDGALAVIIIGQWVTVSFGTRVAIGDLH